MKRKLLAGAVAASALVLAASPAWAQDAEPTAAEVQDALQATLDNVWILIAAVLVIFMQAGFALVEAGLTRAKNVGNIMMKNLMDFSVGALVFFAAGFAIAYGGDFDGFGSVFGGGGWFLNDDAFTYGTLTVFTFFVFQVAFAATAATIVSGAMAERTKFKAYLIYTAVISLIIYPVVVRWQWGGGWLAQGPFGLDPFHDFAGSTIVHSVGGWAALAGAIVLGPRLGKYGKGGKPRAILGHSIPFAIVGTIILLIGWFGFNPGSWLAADVVVGEIALITALGGVAGACVAMGVIWAVAGKPDVAMTANGLLAGLVGVTAGAFVFSTIGAIIAGGVAGALVVGSVLLIDRLGVDDPVGAISVHGVGGVWGTLAVGLFATDAPKNEGLSQPGLFYGGGLGQLASQAVGVIAVAIWVLATAFLLFFLLKKTVGLRVSVEEEVEGLDLMEHGAPGYSDDVLAGATFDGATGEPELRSPVPA